MADDAAGPEVIERLHGRAQLRRALGMRGEMARDEFAAVALHALLGPGLVGPGEAAERAMRRAAELAGIAADALMDVLHPNDERAAPAAPGGQHGG